MRLSCLPEQLVRSLDQLVLMDTKKGFIRPCFIEITSHCCCFDMRYYLQMAGSSAGRKCGAWSAEDMDRALSAMERGDIGLNAAAKSYNVPKATLSRHQKSTNLIANGSVKFHGQSCVLTQSMEEELVTHCLQSRCTLDSESTTCAVWHST